MQVGVTGIIILLLIAFAMYRRMRPQKVQPQRVVTMTVIIVVVSVLSLIGNNYVTASSVALILALPALLVGLGGGLLMMRSIHFWRDKATGALWMKGGVVYLIVWLATVVLRQLVAYANGAYSASGPRTANPTLATLSADLIVVSIGLWIARAVALTRAYQTFP